MNFVKINHDSWHSPMTLTILGEEGFVSRFLIIDSSWPGMYLKWLQIVSFQSLIPGPNFWLVPIFQTTLYPASSPPCPYPNPCLSCPHIYHKYLTKLKKYGFIIQVLEAKLSISETTTWQADLPWIKGQRKTILQKNILFLEKICKASCCLQSAWMVGS